MPVMKIEETRVKGAFASYVRNYNPEDEKVKLKIVHTYKVAELCRKIAESLSLAPEDVEFAWLLGMLHDVGRFEQLRRYNTFSDADSIDHALFGADLLFGEEQLIRDYLGFEKEAPKEEELALMDTRTMHGGTYSLKERRWVETGGRQASGLTEESIYELAYSFSDNHPEILAAYGCRPEDVQVFYASDSAPPVMLLTQGQNNYLFTGDLEAEGEESLVEENDLPECKLFKAGHHGSPTSSNDVLLSVIRPEIVVVCCCCGSDEYTDNVANMFPSQAFVDRVAKYTDRIYVTTVVSENDAGFEPMNGNIVLSSDGGEVSVRCSASDLVFRESEWFKENRTWPSAG